MNYPHVITEDETLDAALTGRSLSRFGDGEFRNAIGGNAAAQHADPRLAAELCDILAKPQKALVCIPHAQRGPKQVNWQNYTRPKYVALLRQPSYGSAFVTRPDSAPWIDRPDYWDKIKQTWRGKEVTLVIGTQRSLTLEMMKEAKSINLITGPGEDAYAKIDEIEARIGLPKGVVILCLGPTATVLAVRLVNKGVHAIDLGHVGMFLRRKEREANDH